MDNQYNYYMPTEDEDTFGKKETYQEEAKKERKWRSNLRLLSRR